MKFGHTKDKRINQRLKKTQEEEKRNKTCAPTGNYGSLYSLLWMRKLNENLATYHAIKLSF